MSRAPAVSVVMPAYNHAEFVVEAIESVLGQDFGDLELLVGDDGSRDETVARARSVRDPRLEVIESEVNRGAAAVHNELVARARGRYVAVINSDDVWMPGKLSKQLAFLEGHPDFGACFGRARFVARDGADIPKESLDFGGIFDVDNRSRGAWLRHFFLRGNCLCHPTALLRREVYARLGPYDNRLRQLPDFDMWVRLVKACAFYVFPDEFIRFRILPGENASSHSSTNSVRLYNEHYFIARRFFDGAPADILRAGFSDLLIHAELPTPEHLEIEKAFLFLQSAPSLGPVYTTLALTMLHNLLASRVHRSVLARDYDFDDCALHRLAAEATAFNLARLGAEIEENWREEKDSIRRDLESIGRDLAAMRSSTSWRATSLFRSIMRMMRGY